MTWLWIFILILVLFFGMVVFIGSPYVPSRKHYIKQALSELYPLSNKDTLVDIGSGDGVVLRQAAKIGARAIGYEINPLLVLISRYLSRRYSKVSVRLADFWITNLPDETTVIYVFSVIRDIKKIMQKVQNETNRLGRPIHLISFAGKFENKKVVKNIGAYYLYTFHPLQSDEAQV